MRRFLMAAMIVTSIVPKVFAEGVDTADLRSALEQLIQPVYSITVRAAYYTPEMQCSEQGTLNPKFMIPSQEVLDQVKFAKSRVLKLCGNDCTVQLKFSSNGSACLINATATAPRRNSTQEKLYQILKELKPTRFTATEVTADSTAATCNSLGKSRDTIVVESVLNAEKIAKEKALAQCGENCDVDVTYFYNAIQTSSSAVCKITAVATPREKIKILP